jgi:putative chitinase
MAIQITAEQIRTLCPGVPLARASQYAAALTAALADSTLDTPLRVRHFMAQLAWESAGFRALVENLSYKNPETLDKTFKSVQGVDHAKRLIDAGPVAIGNLVYANKLGNGSVDSGDGYRYRGRGFIMTTGRCNYAGVARYTKLDFVANPDLLGLPEHAAVAARCFWEDRHINAAADADNVREVTRVVNGPALHGLDGRTEMLTKAAAIWT